MSTPTCKVPGEGVLARWQRRNERFPGDLYDLERPDDATPIGRQDLRGGRRVDLGEAGMQRARTDGRKLVFQPRPHRRVGGGKLETIEDRAYVERRATDEHGRADPTGGIH